MWEDSWFDSRQGLFDTVGSEDYCCHLGCDAV